MEQELSIRFDDRRDSLTDVKFDGPVQLGLLAAPLGSRVFRLKIPASSLDSRSK